jgi:hypothetical protein
MGFSDADASKLQSIMQYAASQWEEIFQYNNHTINVSWFWDSDLPAIVDGVQPSISASGFNILDEDDDGRVDYAMIRFNTNRTDWWFDGSPDNDSEFNMAQLLFRDLDEPSWQYLTSNEGVLNPPDVFETSYSGNAFSAEPAKDLRDAVTVAMHEMGHTLSMVSSHTPNVDETADNDYDLDSSKIAGMPVTVLARGHANNDDPNESEIDLTSHLSGNRPLLGRNPNSRRKRPSTADVLALSIASGLSEVVVPRTDILTGSNWFDAGAWIGNRVPSSTIEASVRHGGTISLSDDVHVATLLVDEQSRVITEFHDLLADDVSIQRTLGVSVAAIEVSSLGFLGAETIRIGNGGLLFVD